jgi:hypothetical protein
MEELMVGRRLIDDYEERMERKKERMNREH